MERKSRMENMEKIEFNKDFWDGKNVLVTGGTGFIGSHITEELLNLNSNIVIPYIELLPKSYFLTKKFNEKTILIPCDIKDRNKVSSVISKYDIDIIFHLAAQPIVSTSYKNPVDTFETNILGTINVLDSARHFSHVTSIVVASSDKSYGHSEKLPYTEDLELKGIYPYELSKVCTDLIARSYYKNYGLPVTVTRFGNVYGPGDLNFSRIIPGIMLSLVKNKTLDIRSNGQLIRNYVYVKDVARGYISLAENIDKVKGEAFNFGSPEKLSVIDVINLVSKILNTRVDYKILNNAKPEIAEQYLSYEKIKNTIGWSPKFDFTLGIRQTFEWYKASFG